MTDTVLITGGLGYVGGRVSRFLHSQDWNLRLTTRQTKLVQSTLPERTEVVPLDLLTANNLEELCRGARFVIHLAAQNAIESERDPEQALLVNGLGTLKLLEAAKREGVERFIYFSTGHVYGSPLVGTITEQTTVRPLHPYSITHHTAEDFVLATNVGADIRGIVLRLSNGFGAPARVDTNCWMLIFNDLCKQAVTTKKLVLRSHGCQWRDFISLSDVARAVGHVFSLPSAECDDGIFNLGGECALRIIDVAEKIAERCRHVLGFRPPIERPSPPPGEAFPGLDYQIEKLKSTGFTLTGNIDQEIDETLEFCKEAFA